LSDTPEILPAGSWGTIHLSAAEIVPGTTYEVRTDYGGGRLSPGVSVTTAIWADVAPPIDIVDFRDISAVVSCYKGVPANPIEYYDLQPEVPDHLVNFRDIAGAVNAYKGLPYPHSLPCP
jgi:hypothetical protein